MKKDQTGGAWPYIVIVILLVIIGLGGWYIWNQHKNTPAPAASNTTLNTTTNNTTKTESTQSDGESISSRAEYAYKYYISPGDTRLADLETKGYVTSKYAQQSTTGMPLVCDQTPLTSLTFSYAEPVVTGKSATLTTAITNGTTKINSVTTWIKDADTWKIDASSCPSAS